MAVIWFVLACLRVVVAWVATVVVWLGFVGYICGLGLLNVDFVCLLGGCFWCVECCVCFEGGLV